MAYDMSAALDTSPAPGAFRRVETLLAGYSVSQVTAVDAVCAALDSTVAQLLADVPSHGEAFVTFATPEYRFGLIVWLRSLRKISDRPAIVLVSRPIALPQDIANVYMVQVPALTAETYSFERSEFQHVLSKLWVFALTSLKRVVFVDADCLFLKPVEELFARPGFLVCPDYVEHRKSEKFNTGVLAFSPSEELRQLVFGQLALVDSDDGGDQGALNVILADIVEFADEKFNVLRHFHYFAGPGGISDMRIVHYIVKKPWELQYRETPDAMLVELDDLWTRFLDPDERLELIAHWRRSVFYQSERTRIETVGSRALLLQSGRIDALEGGMHALQRRHRIALYGILGVAGGVGLMLVFWLAGLGAR